jgi:transcriptional regulator with GAF, ATPase, and Fis domain
MKPRSVLWIGSADGLHASAMSQAPEIDLVWAREPHEAFELPLASFACVVMDADAGGAAVAEDLRRAGAAAVLVTDDPARFPRVADLGGAAAARQAPRGVIGASEAMRQTLALVVRAQATHATVLLTGETGTGKEVLARAVHAGGSRARRAFVALNCAAFPESLLESELFGHARGAFTGADRAKDGLFVAADGGTLFLDEIGETSLPFQVKLLRALQEREVRPVGGNRTQRVDVRVIAATNRELRREVDRGVFRADLYYRIAVFPIRVPALRERRDDVAALASHFLALHGEREGKRGCRLAADALDLLVTHAWPGNVRELENEMLRALALSEPGDEIPAARLSARLGDGLEPAREGPADGEPLRVTLARNESWLLRRSLAQHGGRRAETARALGLTREGLHKKLKRLGVA